MEEVLAVQDLHKRFGSGSRLVRANDGITMDVKAGEVVGVLGHNGAGKTTLVNQIVGLYKPHSGSITVGGVDVVAEPELARRLVSVQAQANVPITGISPRKAIELTGRIRGGRRRAMRARASELIDVLDMGEWADKLAEKVSGGVARLTAFAMAVAQPGDLVVRPTTSILCGGACCGTRFAGLPNAGRPFCSSRTTSERPSGPSIASCSSTTERSSPRERPPRSSPSSATECT